MSDTVAATAPSSASPQPDPIEAGAARLAAARTAANPPATPQPQPATPESAPRTAGAAESPEPAQDTDTSTLGEDDGGGQSTEESSQPQQDEQDPVAFTLADGTPVKRSEAEKGYLRQQDYTQKTTLLAQGRDVLMGQLQELATDKDAVAQVLLDSLPQLDPELARADPGEYLARREQRDAVLRKVAELRAGAQADREKVKAARLQQEQELLPAVIPEWSDQATRLRQQQRAREYLTEIGCPPEVVEQIRSSVWLARIARDAATGKPVREGAAKGGAAAAAARQAQPSPSVTSAQVRPPANVRARQTAAVKDAARGTSLRNRLEAGARLLRPIGT